MTLFPDLQAREQAPSVKTKATAKKTPTARTLEALRRLGWPAQVVEKWLPGKRANKKTGAMESTPYGVRKDLFGCIDIVALDGRPGSLGVQACAGGDAARRAKKAMEEPLLRTWLEAGNRFEVWGWREIWASTGAKTKRKMWLPFRMAISLRNGELVAEDHALSEYREAQEVPRG